MPVWPGVPAYAPAPYAIAARVAPTLPPIRGLPAAIRWLALGVGIVSGALAVGAYYYAGVLPSTPMNLIPGSGIGLALIALGLVPCALVASVFWAGDGTPPGRVGAAVGVLLGLFAFQALMYAALLFTVAVLYIPLLPAVLLAPLGFAAGFRWSGMADGPDGPDGRDATDALDATLTSAIGSVYLPAVIRQYRVSIGRRHGAQAGRIAAVGGALIPCAVFLVWASASVVLSTIAPPPPPSPTSCGIHSICIPNDVSLAGDFLVVTVIAAGCSLAVLGAIGAAWLGALLRAR